MAHSGLKGEGIVKPRLRKARKPKQRKDKREPLHDKRSYVTIPHAHLAQLLSAQQRENERAHMLMEVRGLRCEAGR